MLRFQSQFISVSHQGISIASTYALSRPKSNAFLHSAIPTLQSQGSIRRVDPNSWALSLSHFRCHNCARVTFRLGKYIAPIIAWFAICLLGLETPPSFPPFLTDLLENGMAFSTTQDALTRGFITSINDREIIAPISRPPFVTKQDSRNREKYQVSDAHNILRQLSRGRIHENVCVPIFEGVLSLFRSPTLNRYTCHYRICKHCVPTSRVLWNWSTQKLGLQWDTQYSPMQKNVLG